MGDLRRENVCFSLKWGICEEKTRDFRLNRGFSNLKTRDFRLNMGVPKRKRDFRLNGGSSKRKRVIFAKMRDYCRGNASFSG